MNKFVFVIIIILFLFVGIGVMAFSKEKINIDIKDGNVISELSVKRGIKVSDALKKAEIMLNEGDEIEPSINDIIDRDDLLCVIKRKATVQITENGSERSVTLTGGKVNDALASAGVLVDDNDHIDHDRDAFLYDGMNIRVSHLKSVNISVDGRTLKCDTELKTVAEVISEQDIAISKDDEIEPSLDTELSERNDIIIKRITFKDETVTEDIPYETKTEYSNSIVKGKSKIKTEGQNGERTAIYRVKYTDGKETERELVKESVTKDPIAKVIIKGNKPKGPTVVSKQKVDDCDGSGHGYYVIKYSDGTVKYEDY